MNLGFCCCGFRYFCVGVFVCVCACVCIIWGGGSVGCCVVVICFLEWGVGDAIAVF